MEYLKDLFLDEHWEHCSIWQQLAYELLDPRQKELHGSQQGSPLFCFPKPVNITTLWDYICYTSSLCDNSQGPFLLGPLQIMAHSHKSNESHIALTHRSWQADREQAGCHTSSHCFETVDTSWSYPRCQSSGQGSHALWWQASKRLAGPCQWKIHLFLWDVKQIKLNYFAIY